MTKAIFVGVSIFTVVTAVVPAVAVERTAKELRDTSSPPNSTKGDCEARIEKLDASNAEGEERLAEKNQVIGFCARDYEHNNTIKRGW